MYESFLTPYSYLVIDGAYRKNGTHNDTWLKGGEEYWRQVTAFLIWTGFRHGNKGGTCNFGVDLWNAADAKVTNVTIEGSFSDAIRVFNSKGNANGKPVAEAFGTALCKRLECAAPTRAKIRAARSSEVSLSWSTSRAASG